MRIGAIAILALSAAAFADRLYPPAPPAPEADAPAEAGGVWVCPVVKVAGAAGYLHFVNAGESRATVRVTYVPDGRRTVEQALTIGSRRALTVGTPGGIAANAAGAIVEYAGGNLTVSRTVLIGGPGGISAGAAACARPGGVVQVVPQGGTLQAETQLALMNAGTADAVVDIALLVGGQEVRPVSLQGRVVPAHRRLVVREGDFAFDARAVAAVITARTGRIVADAIFVARSLIDLVPGMNATRDLVALASTARGAAFYTTVAVEDEDAVVDAYVLSASGRTSYPPLSTALAPNTPQVASVDNEELQPGAVAVATTSKTSAIASGARWGVLGGRGTSETAIAPGVQPANSTVAVVGPPATSSSLRLLVANPDTTEAVLSIVVVTEAGATEPARLREYHLGPGRTATITIPGLTQRATVGVIVTSAGARVGAVLEAVVNLPSSFAAYAVAGIPISAAPPVAVEADARQGVPA